MNNAEFDLTGKAILVTGALGLIGSEVCDAYAAYGATLIMADIQPAELLETRARLMENRYKGSRVLAVQVDICSEDSVAALFQKIRRQIGKLDVLVNLAAIDAKVDPKAGGVNPTKFENFPFDAWQKSLDVNCSGLFRVTQAAAGLMLEQKSGNIINVASTYSLVAPNQDLYKYPGEAHQTFKPVDYVASKSVVPNLTRYLATLYARDGIRCNAVAPHAVENRQPETFKTNFARLSPLGRLCNVSELRGPFVFLASDASSYMTGSVLVVDGGWTAW